MTVATPKSPRSTTDLAEVATALPSGTVVVSPTDVETAEQACVTYQVAVVSVGPLQSLFETTPLTMSQWLVCMLVAINVIGVEEARKAYGRRVHSIRSIHQSDIKSSTGRPIPC